MDRDKILAAAKAAKPKIQIEEHREAVQVLRDKGYTWREITEFLNQQGIQIDHTRVYRTFGKLPKQNPSSSRSITINSILFKGERKTKKNNTWNILELELPSKLGPNIILVGHAWGTGSSTLDFEQERELSFRNASLVIKSGNKFPFAYIKLELQIEGGHWSPQDVYIMPKWEDLI